ncbi:substrate-binding periplasmic protein [Psychromonas sp. PT13]|uniref:substrate-binding periplasmic protein n=1 Tax=Psychromonas sp. PT13 TaxID=3439547 RepID=UPI003EBB51CD
MYKFMFLLFLFSPLSRADVVSDRDCLSMYVVVNNSSGFLDANGQIAGYHVDFLNELETRSGLCINKKLVPYSRALKGLEYGEYDAGIVAKTDYLSQKVLYLNKLITSKTVIIPRKGLTLNTYQDLENIIIGRFRGVDLNDILATKLHFSLVDLYSYEHGLKMLKVGRIDAIVGNNLGLSIIPKLGMLNDVNLPGSLVIGSREVWFVASKRFKDKNKINLLRMAVNSMIADGKLDRILAKYFGENWKMITHQYDE